MLRQAQQACSCLRAFPELEFILSGVEGKGSQALT